MDETMFDERYCIYHKDTRSTATASSEKADYILYLCDECARRMSPIWKVTKK